MRARRLFLRWALKEASSTLVSLKSLVSQMPRWAQPSKSSVQIMSLSNFSGKCIRWKKIRRFILRRSPSPFPGKQNGSFLSRTNFHLQAEMRRTFVRKIEDDEKKWKKFLLVTQLTPDDAQSTDWLYSSSWQQRLRAVLAYYNNTATSLNLHSIKSARSCFIYWGAWWEEVFL